MELTLCYYLGKKNECTLAAIDGGSENYLHTMSRLTPHILKVTERLHQPYVAFLRVLSGLSSRAPDCLNVVLDYSNQQAETYPKIANLDSVILILWYLKIVSKTRTKPTISI